MSGSTINVQLFIQLFPNITKIEIYKWYNTRRGLQGSVYLDAQLLNMLIKSVEIVSETKGCLLASIIIANPLDDMDNFINSNQSRFKLKGWKLEKIRYKNVTKGNESDALSITRIHGLVFALK